MLENHQVHGQRPEPGAVDSAESGTPAGRGATCVFRRRISRCAGRAAPAPPPRPGSPPAETSGKHPGQRPPKDQGRRSRHPQDSGPRSGPGPPSSWTPPGCPAASPASASSPPPAPRPAAAARGGFRPGRSSELGGIEEFPLFRDPDRSAAASCSRSPATTASSTEIRSACVAIRCACSRISASRGSSGGTSVTAPDHPRNHAQPPRQHHACRQNVTVDHAPQQQAQGPERLPQVSGSSSANAASVTSAASRLSPRSRRAAPRARALFHHFKRGFRPGQLRGESLILSPQPLDFHRLRAGSQQAGRLIRQAIRRARVA